MFTLIIQIPHRRQLPFHSHLPPILLTQLFLHITGISISPDCVLKMTLCSKITIPVVKKTAILSIKILFLKNPHICHMQKAPSFFCSCTFKITLTTVKTFKKYINFKQLLKKILGVFLDGYFLLLVVFPGFQSLEFDENRWSCQWNSDQNCTQNSARRYWGGGSRGSRG